MKKIVLLSLLALFYINVAQAQRFTDNLDRGLVAVNMGGGNVFLSWRILPDEYYGCTYTVTNNNGNVKSNLTASNCTIRGDATNTFTVTTTVNGEVRTASTKAMWTRHQGYQAGYMEFDLAPVYDRNNKDKTWHYIPNDVIFADLDGDGQLDYIVKRVNRYDVEGFFTGEYDKDKDGNYYYDNHNNLIEVWNSHPTENETEFTIWDAYKLDWNTGIATRLWWLDCGPNMASDNDVESNLLAYDWDMDGKAEVVMRGADNMVFHYANGETMLVGNNVNTRGDFDHHSGKINLAWTKTGNEYLLYFNGETGRLYQMMEYPLKRYEDGEDTTNIDAAWHGRNQYGHVSTKHFFGAPYLDGRKPSLFIGRGIYTRHKMIAYDIDPNHNLIPRWEWHSTANGSNIGSNWYANGFHNYVIADVDEDGRDEIVYGGMVIDDNGKGLSTTAFGHGDAMHVNDFDPYRKGLEIYTCHEDSFVWGMAYRSGLTGKIYKRYVANNDDARALAGNFINDIPGSIGKTLLSNALALTSDKYVGQYNNAFKYKINNADTPSLNFRIYWDSDLLSELFDGTGSNIDPNGRGGTVMKYNGTEAVRLIQNVFGNTVNGTKNNPSFQGDIMGDWREELVMRMPGTTVTEYHSKDSIYGKTHTYTYFNKMHVTTSTYSTQYPIYHLWADHQYRQAMGTQMQTYNLPPNPSFFLGEMEGITQAPPPLMNRGREEVRNGGTISTSHDGRHVMLAETGNAQVNVAEGANPKIFTDNASWWVQGSNPSEATGVTPSTTTVYTHTLTGAPFTGETMVVKQGCGTLVLPGEEQTYTGDTKVWAGTLKYDGRMTNSAVWLNRFAMLSSNGGEFKNVTTEYGSEIQPGGPAANVGEVTIENLSLGFGSRIVLDINGMNDGDNDQIHITNLTLETKTGNAWENYGPKNLKPVFLFNTTEVLPGGNYPIGTLANLPASVTEGMLNDVIIEGMDANRNPHIMVNDGVIYLHLNDMAPTVEPNIDIVDMVQTDLTDLFPSSDPTIYYMPKVGITVPDINGVQPTLTGTFTSLSGIVTELGATKGKTMMNVDFNNYTTDSLGQWVSPNYPAGLSLQSGDPTYMKYIKYTCADQNSRVVYWTFGDLEMDDNPYVIEFDASITPGTQHPTQLAVMASTPLGGNQLCVNYLFSAQNSGTGTSYFINGGSSITIPSDEWCHYKIEVDVRNRQVLWTITKGSSQVGSGTYDLPLATGTKPTGIHFLSGRRNSVLKFDNFNIRILPADLSSYTFKEPGTLRVTVKGSGAMTDNYKSFTVENPYAMVSGKDYYVDNFNKSRVPERWTCPNETEALTIKHESGERYLSLDLSQLSNGSYCAYCDLKKGTNRIDIDTDVYTISFDAKIKPSTSSNTQNQIALLAGNLPANNELATSNLLFSAVNEIDYAKRYTVSTSNNRTFLLPSNIWCCFNFTIDKTKNTIEWTITRKSDGKQLQKGIDNIVDGRTWNISYLYFVLGNHNSLGIDNVKIYPQPNLAPVSVHDELLTNLPSAVTDGNVHLWRSGLNTNDSWTSLVLPFDMTSEEITQVFGGNAQVANLIPNKGSAALFFETVSRTIHANQPVLIKGVTKSAPYLIQGVTSNPAVVPVVQNNYYQYIGNYDNKGAVPFYKNVDYLYLNDGLNSVNIDGEYVILNGYRGYFHANNPSQSTVMAFFDAQPLLGDVNGDGMINVTDVTEMVNYVLGEDVDIVLMNADVNGDGLYNIADVTSIINLVLSE